MSQLLTKSPKHCAKQGHKFSYKSIFFLATASFTTLLLLVFLIWIVLRPSKPNFALKETHIYQLALPSPNLLNSSIQLTILSQNPNKRVGIYYDQFQLYGAYNGQQITAHSALPPFYQGHQEDNLLTATLTGTELPVGPYLGYQVGRDQSAGRLIIRFKVSGRLRWKVGTWVSGPYRFNVNCIAVVPFVGLGPEVGPAAPALPSGSNQLGQGAQCSTSV